MDEIEFVNEIWSLWRPPQKMNLSEWADRHAVLSAESSAEIGRWKTIPYQRGIMDAITNRRTTNVSVMKSARVGWTKIINHTVGFHMHHDPCPIMVVQPTIGDAEGYSKDEIAPMLRDTPVLENMVQESRRRESSNTILAKSFPGGKLLMVGADSPRGFRRVSIRVILFDETDGYSQTAGQEGDQLKLGIRRTEYFWNRKILAGSTPTLIQTSRINTRFLMGSQNYYFVPCPHCQHPQVLKWERIRWEKDKPETAHYVCENCEEKIEYKWHRWMISEADKRNLAGDKQYGWVATNPDAPEDHESFHIWAAYSYSPNATWAQLAREWLESHKNTEERKTFINTVLGIPYEGEGDAPDWKKLYDRRETYERNKVPAGGLILFAGADVQKDRIEVEIVAYGRNMESWSVDYRVIPGSTDVITGKDSAYPKLAQILDELWEHESGGEVRLQRLAIDTGYNTNTVYQWIRQYPVNRVIGVDGRDSYNMTIGTPKKVEVKINGKRKGRSVMLWPVGSSLLKTELYGWLKQEKPDDGEEIPHGWCHFPQYGKEYFKGMTAEEVVVRIVKGIKRYQWELVGDFNEPIDCRVYARAAASLEGIERWDDDKWDNLEAEINPEKEAETFSLADMQKNRKSKGSKDPYL